VTSEQEVYYVADLRRSFRISERTIYRWLQEGLVKGARKIRGVWMVPRPMGPDPLDIFVSGSPPEGLPREQT